MNGLPSNESEKSEGGRLGIFRSGRRLLTVAIVALWINRLRYAHDPSIDTESTSDLIASVIGYPLGRAFGAVHGYSRLTGKKLNHTA